MLSNHEAELLLFENHSFSSFMLQSKTKQVRFINEKLGNSTNANLCKVTKYLKPE